VTGDHGPLGRAVVRVWDRAGDVVGTGFLLGPGLVATCAHVVTTAIGGDPEHARPPAGTVDVDFPLLPGAPPRSATVHRWQPIRPDGGGDVAVLRLATPAPPGASVPPLKRADRLWDHEFRTLGFPGGSTDGVWATGRFRDRQGAGWVQLHGASPGPLIGSGFSGGAVWDATETAVVGMTVAADRDPGAATAYLLPIEQVIGIDPDLLPNPYRGLAAFDEEHADFFCGRTAEIDRLAAALSAHQLVAVVGGSGVGKSSLVRAGLVPRLRADGIRVSAGQLVPTVPPEVSLALALPSQQPGVDQLRRAHQLGARLRHPADRATAIRELAAGTARTVVVIDQFEELVAAAPAAARFLFGVLTELLTAAPGLRVVLTLRAESLTQLLVGSADAARLQDGLVLVSPMTRAQLREAITGPAARAPGLYFADGLVERVLDDAGSEPGQLPLVESLLAQLWEERTGGYLTNEAYERAGGVAGALTRQAERAMAMFDGPTTRSLVRRLLTSLARQGEGDQFYRRAVPLDALPADVATVVEPLARARLVTVGPGPDRVPVVEIAHQALIDNWPRLRQWLAEDRDFLVWQEQLDSALTAWEDARHDGGALLRGAALARAQEWVGARGAELPARQVEFVRASRARQRREVRRWRSVTAVLAVLVLVAGVLTVLTVRRSDELADQLATGNASTLATLSTDRTIDNPDAATQFALAAYRSDPTSPQALDALATQYLAMRDVETIESGIATEQDNQLELSRDGDSALVQAPDDGLVLVTGLTTGARHTWRVPGIPDTNRKITPSPDGKRIAAWLADGRLLVWDAANHRGPTEIGRTGWTPGQDSIIGFAPDSGRLFLSDTRWSRYEVWDLARNRRTRDGAPGAGTTGMWLTERENVAVVQTGEPADPGSVLAVRDLDTGAESHRFPFGSVVVQDGAGVLSCAPGADGPATATVADSATGAARVTFPLSNPDSCGAEPGVNRLLVSADREHLIEDFPSTTEDQQFRRVFRFSDGARFDVLMPPASSDLDTAARVHFEFAGAMGATALRDGTPVLLAAIGGGVFRFRGRDSTWLAGSQRVAGTTDLRHVVVADDEGVAVRDAANGREMARLADLPSGEEFLGWRLTETGLDVTTQADDHRTVSRFAVPDLNPVVRQALPVPRGVDPELPDVDSMSDETVARLYAGVLTVWDRDTGKRRHEPLELGETARQKDFYQRSPAVAARPGHPDEVAVVGLSGDLELWNIASRKKIRTFPATMMQPVEDLVRTVVFDPTGAVVATLGENGAQTSRWWVATGKQVGDTLDAPSPIRELVGFDAASDLITTSPLSQRNGQLTVSFWSADRERMAEFHTVEQVSTRVRLAGSWLVLSGDQSPPVRLSTDSAAWAKALCAVSDRPFTDAERRVLPAETDVSPPCGSPA
jgi:WD40 repeat protein